MNKYQIQQLKDLMIVPQVVIAFELSDEEVIDRLSKVKLDPMTGKIYQSEEDAEPQIRKRLVDKSENTLPQIEKRLNDYHEFLASAETDFNQYLIRINAEEPESRIFLNFCDAIENSV